MIPVGSAGFFDGLLAGTFYNIRFHELYTMLNFVYNLIVENLTTFVNVKTKICQHFFKAATPIIAMILSILLTKLENLYQFQQKN